MRKALQREGAKGGSLYAECVEPASESCMSSEILIGRKYSVCRR